LSSPFFSDAGSLFYLYDGFPYTNKKETFAASVATKVSLLTCPNRVNTVMTTRAPFKNGNYSLLFTPLYKYEYN